jgi:hypothetical protein
MPFDIAEARARIADLHLTDSGRVRDRIRALARPRMTGTPGAAAVEAQVRQRFEELGYGTREMPFSFSSWPGRFGICVSGAALALAGALGAWLIAAGIPVGALAVLVLFMAAALAPLVVLETALFRLPWGRTEGRSLLFTRPHARPAWILMAHRDTKSQLLPTLVRSAAAIVGAAAWALLVVLTLLSLGDDALRLPGLAITAGIVTVAAGAALALSWAGNESPGALDNASGMAALLEVAAECRDPGDVAFLVTDAEELGLVGARRAIPLLPPVQGVINVDALDDHGMFYVTEGYGWRRRGSAPQLAAALMTAAAALDLPITRRPLPRTLFVDHLPLAESGIPALTLLRGGWHSLVRVHARSDDADQMDGTGAAAGANLLSATILLLRADAAAHLAARRSAPS